MSFSRDSIVAAISQAKTKIKECQQAISREQNTIDMCENAIKIFTEKLESYDTTGGTDKKS